VKKQAEPQPPPTSDLGTPTLKSKNYTTGRGGTGNMAVNDPERPELAREAQDVDVPHVPLVAEKNFPTGRGEKRDLRSRNLGADRCFRRRWQHPQPDAGRTSRSKAAQ
jgi:Protein of unknown function (DUF3602)